jgi:hypothetical protein
MTTTNYTQGLQNVVLIKYNEDLQCTEKLLKPVPDYVGYAAISYVTISDRTIQSIIETATRRIYSQNIPGKKKRVQVGELKEKIWQQ